MLKSTRQLVCVFQDMEPPKSLSILRKSSNIRKPIWCVKFKKKPPYVTLTFETKNHRLQWFVQVNLISAAPTLQNLRIGLRKRRNGKSDVPVKQRGNRPKYPRFKGEKQSNILLTFGACLHHQPLNLRKREFVVDSRASMHLISKKYLNSAELETVTTSCSPTIVITAKGEVQTHEEATVYVKELDMFLTMTVLEDTPAVLSLGKLCDEHRYSYECINGQKPQLIINGIRIHCNTENFVPIVVLTLSTISSSSFPSSTSMTPTRQEMDHPTSSSSSSTSPTTTVSSDIETRAREDLSGIDSYPVSASSEHVERKERATRSILRSGVAARIQWKFGGWWNSSIRRLTRQFFSWSFFRAHIQETWGFG